MAVRSRTIFASWLRNFVFGVDDGLVSTVGLLSGIAVAGVSRPTIILTGLILITVEAFSMAVGSFLSEHSAEEYVERKETSFRLPLVNSIIMLLSYIGAGLIPLFPYFFFDARSALWYSIILSLATLFLLGSISAKLSKTNILKHSLEMLIIGGAAILVGIIMGRLLTG